MTALTPNDYEILFKSSAWQALPADDRAQPLEEHILATTKSHDALPAQKTNKHTSRHHCSAAEDQTFESYVKKVRQGFEDLLRTNLFRNKDVDISSKHTAQYCPLVMLYVKPTRG